MPDSILKGALMLLQHVINTDLELEVRVPGPEDRLEIESLYLCGVDVAPWLSYTAVWEVLLEQLENVREEFDRAVDDALVDEKAEDEFNRRRGE